MKKSGLADSPFFSTPQLKGSGTVFPDHQAQEQVEVKDEQSSETSDSPQQPEHPDTKQPRNHDTTVSRYHDTAIESVRRAVKEFGKEAATHRFTLEEKRAIAEIIYAYQSRSLRTSENEITRIAINFIINDFKQNGEDSILDRVLRALNR
jgi:hypothetical protein